MCSNGFLYKDEEFHVILSGITVEVMGHLLGKKCSEHLEVVTSVDGSQ